MKRKAPFFKRLAWVILIILFIANSLSNAKTNYLSLKSRKSTSCIRQDSTRKRIHKQNLLINNQNLHTFCKNQSKNKLPKKKASHVRNMQLRTSGSGKIIDTIVIVSNSLIKIQPDSIRIVSAAPKDEESHGVIRKMLKEGNDTLEDFVGIKEKGGTLWKWLMGFFITTPLLGAGLTASTKNRDFGEKGTLILIIMSMLLSIAFFGSFIWLAIISLKALVTVLLYLIIILLILGFGSLLGYLIILKIRMYRFELKKMESQNSHNDFE